MTVLLSRSSDNVVRCFLVSPLPQTTDIHPSDCFGAPRPGQLISNARENIRVVVSKDIYKRVSRISICRGHPSKAKKCKNMIFGRPFNKNLAFEVFLQQAYSLIIAYIAPCFQIGALLTSQSTVGTWPTVPYPIYTLTNVTYSMWYAVNPRFRRWSLSRSLSTENST